MSIGEATPFLFQNAAAGNGNGQEMQINPYQASAVIVAMTKASGFDGTVNFEGTIDGTNYFAVQGASLAAAATQGTTVAAAAMPACYRFVTSGLLAFRCRISGQTTGTCTVTGHLAAGSAS